MKDSTNNSYTSFLKLDKNTKTLIWACLVPLMMAIYCIFSQVYLSYVSRQQCRNEGGFSLHISYSIFGHSDLPFLNDLPCADGYNQLLYKLSGVLIYIFISLSIMLPSILYSRCRSVKQDKLFE